jgi:hypothetical protein
MAMLEENFERNFAVSLKEVTDIGFSAFDELDLSIKELGFKDPSWKNWGIDQQEGIFREQKFCDLNSRKL